MEKAFLYGLTSFVLYSLQPTASSWRCRSFSSCTTGTVGWPAPGWCFSKWLFWFERVGNPMGEGSQEAASREVCWSSCEFNLVLRDHVFSGILGELLLLGPGTALQQEQGKILTKRNFWLLNNWLFCQMQNIWSALRTLQVGMIS